MKSKNFWMSLGTAIAASKAVQTISNVTADDVLGVVGLERRRNTVLGSFALVGLGALVGAGAALLFAPMTGEETRKRVSDQLGRAKEAGKNLVNEAKERAPELIEYAKTKARDFEEHGANQHA